MGRKSQSMVFAAVKIIGAVILGIFTSLYYAVFQRPRKDIRNNIVLVTGSAMGLGRELAILFAKEGCEVICVDLKAEENLTTVSMIQDLGGKAKAYLCNVADRKAIMLLAKEVGRVDILVNNAGIYPLVSLWSGTEEEIRTIIDINLFSQIWMIQAFVPGMRERNYGHVVGISSISALNGLPYIIPYATSKAGVQGLMDSVYEQLRLEGSKVNATVVYPYFINTRSEIKECVKISHPPVEPEYAASVIMRGILENRKSFTVPEGYSYLTNLGRILPPQCVSIFINYLLIDISPPKHDEFAEAMNSDLLHKTGKFEKQYILQR